MDDLLQDFLAETREMLEAIAGEIVAWEADPADRARLDEIFRFVHTVKGSCGFLDLPRLARLSHAAEDVLGELRDGTRVADTALVSAVLGIVDRIGELAEAIGTGASLSDEEDHRLIAALSPPDADDGDAGAAVASAPVPLREDAAARTVARTVRLPVDLLDRMMAGVSDMVLARNELARRLRDAEADMAIEASLDRLSVCVAEMRDAITRTRMQRMDNIFSTLPRLVRDLSAETGKRVVLELDGGDVELDREMIEVIRDPLIHVIRNAIDHGIEAPDDRRRLGKPQAGTLAVSARQAGNQIVIEIADDGRGVDGEKVALKAVAAGIVTADQVIGMSWARKVELVFAAGLSTADAVTTLSGRGVGMDVVRANVERIGGLAEVESRPGAGARVILRVPLTLTIIPALTLGVGACHFALPRAAVEEIVRVTGDRARIDRVGGADMATIRGRRLPMVRLNALLGIDGDAPADPPILMVLRPAGGTVYALGVDAVHDHEELVVKPAAPALMESGLYGGTTLPDNGRPMLLLDPLGIAKAAAVPKPGREREPSQPAEPVETVPTLLFRDLDGVERGVRLSVVERVEEAAAGAIIHRAGRLRLFHDRGILPLVACRPVPEERGATILRLADGAEAVGYVIATAIDIHELDARLMPAGSGGGRIAGFLLVDGRPIEMLDPFFLFAEVFGSQPAVASGHAVALGADAGDRWTREVLQPLIETAGIHVRVVAPGEPADLIIATGVGPIEEPGDTPVLRLRSHPEAGNDGDSIYRYDREGLIDAVKRQADEVRR